MSQLGLIGFWAGVGACAATIAYDVAQVLQVLGVLHFPLDEILIFGTSLCIVVPFVLRSSQRKFEEWLTPCECSNRRRIRSSGTLMR
jgi:hypothetical protein